MKYICNVTCWVGGKKKAMFTPGEIVDFAEDEIIPGHFTCIEPPKEEEKEIEKVDSFENEENSPLPVFEETSNNVEIEKKDEIKRVLRKPNLSKE